MPTQIQSLVSSAYTAIVPIPSDGEVLSEASLINALVPCLNRTQFVADELDALPFDRLRAVAALRPRLLTASTNQMGDASIGIAAVSTIGGAGRGEIVLAKGVIAARTTDLPTYARAGSYPSELTSAVRGAARSDSRVLVIAGAGASKNVYSDDSDATAEPTWTAGGALGVTPQHLIYEPVNDIFALTGSSALGFQSSSNGGVAWSSGGSFDDLTGIDHGLAALASGRLVICAAVTAESTQAPAFNISDDTGGTWARTGTVPNAADLQGVGSLAGNGSATVYHAGSFTTPSADVQISSSPDGDAWSVLSTATFPALVDAGACGIAVCQDSGLIVLAASLDVASAVTAFVASVDGGQTWTEALIIRGVFATAGSGGWAVAGGRLFITLGTLVFASDGAGWSL